MIIVRDIRYSIINVYQFFLDNGNKNRYAPSYGNALSPPTSIVRHALMGNEKYCLIPSHLDLAHVLLHPKGFAFRRLP